MPHKHRGTAGHGQTQPGSPQGSKRRAAHAPAGAVVSGALGAAARDSRRRPRVLCSPRSTPMRCSINAGHRTPASRSSFA